MLSGNFTRKTKQIWNSWKFPGGPVVRTWHFRCHHSGLIPGQRTKMLQTMWCGQKPNTEYGTLNNVHTEIFRRTHIDVCNYPKMLPKIRWAEEWTEA